MKGFLQEYGIIMVVVAVVLGMLAFGKTGYAKGIQDAILGSADHIVDTGENIVPKPVKASDTIDIEGKKYIVLEERENNQALVITAKKIGAKKFQSTDRSDGKYNHTYENSEIDNYLENEWYNSLSPTLKGAIQVTNINQDMYFNYSLDSFIRDEYNTISRHVFLPNVREIRKGVDLKSKDKAKSFFNKEVIWTRDFFDDYVNNIVSVSDSDGKLFDGFVKYNRDVRPAFVIDLSKVDYKVTDHVDYK